MLKKIYSRIIIVSFAIVVVLMLVTGTVLFNVVSDFFINDRGEMLKKVANRTNDFTYFYVTSRDENFRRFYYNALNDSAQHVNGMIYIFDNMGNIISSDNVDEHLSKRLTLDSVNQKVFEGEEVIEIGDMNGMLDDTYLTVGVPLIDEGRVVCATFVSVPAPEINKYKYYVFNIFGITIIITFAISMIFSYLYSRKVTKPIKQMNKISKEIANGIYSGRIKTEGRSDVAELANNFNYMANSLENLENMRSNFISSVSHELRTPMTTISGFVEGILDNTIAEEDREKYLKIVLDETKRLARLVEELLEMSRVDSETLKITPKRFNINELIRICVIRFEKQINDKNIDVNIDFECEEEFVYADKDAISRVLINIIDNALKFNEYNGYLNIKVYGSKNSKIKVSIENSGAGLEKEDLENVFERFYKSDKSRSIDKNGLGLGLYLVKNIIATHGESIVCESEKGKWARFTFTMKKA